jgi:hypothetical protein
MGEGFIDSWSYPPIATIHKTTAVWASQDYIRVYYGCPRPVFQKMFFVRNPSIYA